MSKRNKKLGSQRDSEESFDNMKDFSIQDEVYDEEAPKFVIESARNMNSNFLRNQEVDTQIRRVEEQSAPTHIEMEKLEENKQLVVSSEKASPELNIRIETQPPKSPAVVEANDHVDPSHIIP